MLLAGSLFTACLKPEEFPAEPVIEYQAFEQFGDAFSLRDDEQLVVKLAYRFEL